MKRKLATRKTTLQDGDQHHDANSGFLTRCQQAKSTFKNQLEKRLAAVRQFVHAGTQICLVDQLHKRRPHAAPSTYLEPTRPQSPLQPREPASRGAQRLVADSFYGADHAHKVEAVEAVIQRYQKHHRAQYREFPKQSSAMEWAATQDTRVWSAQRSNGSRYFIAASFYVFWHHYYHNTASRHHYEIIHQDHPCKLYFDIEFDATCNSNTDGTALVDTVLQHVDTGLEVRRTMSARMPETPCVHHLLKARFGIAMRHCTVVELDSTTPAKFSRHLVIGLPHAAFVNNRHVGVFVQQVVRDAGDALLVCKDNQDARVSCVDLGVYTRNRAFRLYLSSKAGKETILQPTGRFGWPPPASDASHKELFMASLVCNVDAGARLLTSHGEAAPQAAPAPRRAPCPAPPPARQGPSPFPLLDAFVLQLCRCAQTRTQGSVRSWVHFEEPAVMLYNIRDFRWCKNVARHHKSNGIFFVCDLAGGYLYQKCYDPDCRAYRSPCHALPQAVWEQAVGTLGGGLFAVEGIDEDELVRVIADV